MVWTRTDQVCIWGWCKVDGLRSGVEKAGVGWVCGCVSSATRSADAFLGMVLGVGGSN